MNQNMDVIRHDAPGEQFVAFVMKPKHGVFGNFSDSRITQVTFTNSTIKIFLQPRALLTVVFDLEQMFPLTAT